MGIRTGLSSLPSRSQPAALPLSPSTFSPSYSVRAHLLHRDNSKRSCRSLVILVLKIAGRVPGNLNSYVELIMSVSLYTKIVFSVAWTWIILSVVRAAVKPPLDYWCVVLRVDSCLF